MKKIIFIILSLTLFAPVFGQTLDRSIRPKPGPAPEVKLGKPESFTLPNGMKVFVVENHTLPTISCSIQLDIKPELEGDMAGFHEMMGELLLTGTKTRTNDQLSEDIDFIGATIRATNEGLFGGGLKRNEDKLLELMSDIVLNANMTQDELDKIKKRTLSELETQKNEPDAMMSNVGASLNFGSKHPYGEITTDETAKNISLDRCTRYYQTYFRPNVAYMAIVGDITISEAKKLVEKYFGAWQKADVPVATYSKPTAPASPRVAMVPRDGAVQSVISVTLPIDLAPGSDDVIKARVANSVLGDGSQGRLFLDLREKHAWTYGAYSSITADILGGTFTADTKCRNAVSDSAVGEILKQMHRMQTDKVSDENLQNTIAYMSGTFAIGLENRSTIAQYAINIERYHMPEDYYQNYLKNLSKVTSDDVMAMAQKYITPEHANIIVVGSRDEVAKKLEKFGKVEYFDYLARPIKPDDDLRPAPAGVTADGVLKNYVKAIGGEDAIKNIKDLKTVSKSQIQGIDLTITEIKKAPSQLKQTVEGMGTVFQKEVLNGDKGYMEQQGKRQDLSGDELAQVTKDADIYGDLHPEKYGLKYELKGIQKVNGSDAYVLEETDPKGSKTTMYYDAKTGLFVKQIKTFDTPNGPMAQTLEMSDYTVVPNSGGYKVPYTVVQSAGPQVLNIKVQTVEINKGIPDTEFDLK